MTVRDYGFSANTSESTPSRLTRPSIPSRSPDTFEDHHRWKFGSICSDGKCNGQAAFFCSAGLNRNCSAAGDLNSRERDEGSSNCIGVSSIRSPVRATQFSSSNFPFTTRVFMKRLLFSLINWGDLKSLARLQLFLAGLSLFWHEFYFFGTTSTFLA